MYDNVSHDANIVVREFQIIEHHGFDVRHSAAGCGQAPPRTAGPWSGASSGELGGSAPGVAANVTGMGYIGKNEFPGW